MKHNEIKHVLASRFKKINDCLNKIIKHFNSEEIHDFRVELKKVRAFMRLAATRLPGPEELKIPYHLKSMYRYAGIIRNLQLQEQRIFEFIREKEVNQPDRYLRILSDQKDESKQKILDIYNHMALKTEEEMIIRTLRIRLENTTIENYTWNRTEELKNLIPFHEYADEELHQARKILKDLLYTLPYTGDYFFSFFNGGLQTKEEIESLTDLLGEFQDACTSLQLLQPDYTKDLNDPAEIGLLQTIREEWERKKSEQKAAVCEKLLQFNAVIPKPSSS